MAAPSASMAAGTAASLLITTPHMAGAFSERLVLCDDLTSFSLTHSVACFFLNNRKETDHAIENHFAVPPVWNDPPQGEKKERPLEMVGTSMHEPGCPHEWCRTQDSIKWSGPGQEGFVIAPNGERYPFHPKKGSAVDNEL
jgi:hypothetical protein